MNPQRGMVKRINQSLNDPAELVVLLPSASWDDVVGLTPAGVVDAAAAAGLVVVNCPLGCTVVVVVVVVVDVVVVNPGLHPQIFIIRSS